MSKNHQIVIIADYAQTSSLTWDELREIFPVSEEFIRHLIEYGIITPAGDVPAAWTFDLSQLLRLKAALRLQRDLELNLAGVAMVMDLLDEMEKLRAKAEWWEKHFSK